MLSLPFNNDKIFTAQTIAKNKYKKTIEIPAILYDKYFEIIPKSWVFIISNIPAIETETDIIEPRIFIFEANSKLFSIETSILQNAIAMANIANLNNLKSHNAVEKLKNESNNIKIKIAVLTGSPFFGIKNNDIPAPMVRNNDK